MAATRLAIFLMVAVPFAALSLAVTALWRRKKASLALAVAVVGLASIGTWLVLAFELAGLIMFAALVAAWIFSPFLQRAYRYLWE